MSSRVEKTLAYYSAAKIYERKKFMRLIRRSRTFTLGLASARGKDWKFKYSRVNNVSIFTTVNLVAFTIDKLAVKCPQNAHKIPAKCPQNAHKMPTKFLQKCSKNCSKNPY
jgi:hypothetical protein